MSKIAIIADTHLIHAYHPEYNKINELSRLMTVILKHKPEAIFILGDFFDKKFTNTGHPISHIDGSKRQIPITEIIESTKIPWYALLGNHEDEAVLCLLTKSASNFHFLMTDPESFNKPTANIIQKPLTIDGINFWFSGIQESDTHRNKEIKIKSYCQAAAKSRNNKNIILMHLDFIKRGEFLGIEKELVELLSKNFDLVLNGHEHTYKTKFYGFSNVILVPPSMPTWIGIKEGLVSKYEFADGNLKRKENKLREPHGFMILDTQTLKLEFFPFFSKMPSISILYDVTNKDLTKIDQEWREIVLNIRNDLIGVNNIDSLIIIPIFKGNLGNLMKFNVNSILDVISNEDNSIYITDIKEKNLVSPILDIETPDESEIINLEGVFSKTIEQADEIKNNLEEMGIILSVEQIKKIINEMRQKDYKFFYERGTKTIKDYTADIINTLMPILSEILKKSWKGAEISRIIEESYETKKISKKVK